MHQATSGPAIRPTTATAGRLATWAARLPYIVFIFWMVHKQQLALTSTNLEAGPAMLVATVGGLLFLTPWVFIRPGRIQLIGAAILDFLLTLLIYSDVLYFRQFGDLTSVANLRFAGQLASVGGSVSALVQPADIWLWADIPVLMMLALLPARAAQRMLGSLWQHVQAMRVPPRTAAVIALVGVSALALTAYFDPLMQAKFYGHSNVASRLGLLSYHVYDVGTYSSRMAVRTIPSSGAVTEVQQWFDGHRAAEAGPASPPQDLAGPADGGPARPLHGIARGKNVIIIQVESLQAFPLGLKVGGQEVTPNLNRLAGESVNFTDFYTQTGQGVTSDADLLANCSLHPTRTGAVYYDYAANDFRCMPTLLREHGYHAYAMQGMPPDFWNLATVYPRVGFERYLNIKGDFTMDEQIGIGLSDESFFRQAIPKLKSLPEPYYAFLVTLTSHSPFEFDNLPKPLDMGKLAGTQAAAYLHTIHYTDGAIGHFIDRLKAEGLLDKSVLVLYGDHAGVFRTGTGMNDLLHIPAQDEAALMRMERRIPFLVRLPGGAGAGERPATAGQVDIAPSVAGLLGVPTDSAYFMGRDIFLGHDGTVAFYTGSAVNDRYYWWARDAATGECYDRSNGTVVAPEHCKELAESANRRLDVSRRIVERNLIPALTKKR